MKIADERSDAIELTDEYIPIAMARINYAIGDDNSETDTSDGVQMSIFDFIGG